MLSIKELSDYLGVSPQTIYNRLSAGTFPIKTKLIGRRLKWDRRDVDTFLDKLPTISQPTTIWFDSRDGNWHISVREEVIHFHASAPVPAVS